MRLADPHKRLGQVRDEGSFPHSFEAAGISRPIEQPKQPQQGEGTLSVLPLALERSHVGIHDAESMAALFFVSFLELHQVAFADISGAGIVQPSSEQGQCERVALHVLDQCLELLLHSMHPERTK
jgi:hypothetical protein